MLAQVLELLKLPRFLMFLVQIGKWLGTIYCGGIRPSGDIVNHLLFILHVSNQFIGVGWEVRCSVIRTFGYHRLSHLFLHHVHGQSVHCGLPYMFNHSLVIRYGTILLDVGRRGYAILSGFPGVGSITR